MTDSYRPRYQSGVGPPRMPSPARDAIFEFTANSHPNSNYNATRTPPFGPRDLGSGSRLQNDRYGRRSTSSRPLLRALQEARAESFFPPNAKNKFRDVDTLSDSDGSDMSISDEDDSRPVKKLRLDHTPKADTTLKWSNPDPYTALPPPPEPTGKHMDVVSIIRRAKISDEDVDGKGDLANNADFISLDGGFEYDAPPVDAPTGPKADRIDHLGKRKRGQEDAKPRAPSGYPPSDDDVPVLREWTASGTTDPAPWLAPFKGSDSAAIALHKEVIDFYQWVKPTDYDAEVRADVLKRLSLALNQIVPGVLKAFGSYAAGLYLPSGDMDLVFLCRGYRPGFIGANGLPPPPSRSLLNKFSKRLRDTKFARSGSVLLIPFAKVPIIKFVDEVSGLRVDLSFNNDTGVMANDTVLKWKEHYPSMPIIASVIKQFLLIRGLNDVATGGLGGFSILCLVTSLLQHMPGTASPTNLGQVLIEFFNLYGNLFDRDTVAIRLDPPGYVDKATYKPHLFNKEKANRLTIIDPNRTENNVSGGTSQIQTIITSFASAYHTLHTRLTDYAEANPQDSFSFLRDLIGGDFSVYAVQRNQSKNLYYGITGTQVVEAPIKVPGPKPSHSSGPSQSTNAGPSATSGPIASNGSAASTNMKSTPILETKGLKPAQKRAARLKLARPDIAHLVGNAIIRPKALKMGGYRDEKEMKEDIEKRLNAQPRSPRQVRD